MNAIINYFISGVPALLFVLLSLSGVSQHQKFKPDQSLSQGKMKDRAESAFQTGDVYTALFYYEELIKQSPDDMAIRYRLAELYEASRDYAKAEEAYDYVAQKAFATFPFSMYHKGVMQKMSGKYEEARQTLLKFRKEAGSVGDNDFKRHLSRDIHGCDSGMVYSEFPDNVRIVNAGSSVNAPHTEFSPFFVDSTTILFGSLKEEHLNFYDIGKTASIPKRQIYTAALVNGQWEAKGKFATINDPAMDMGKVAYASHSGKYYFTKCAPNDRGIVQCKIYVTQKVNGKFKEAEVLPAPVNIAGYTSTQPCVVYDAERKTEYLYFVSDRPKGLGGLDIWYTNYNSRTNVWVEPRNARIMNSPKTDCTPFYHEPTQTFYFSSDGRVTAGGLDIYKTWKDQDGRMAPPQNLSFPINSPQDDLDFHLNHAGTKGFLVSNRPGGTPFFHETCCDDIFAFEILPPKPFEAELNMTIVSDDTVCTDKIVKVDIYDLKTKETSKKSLKLNESCDLVFPLEKNTRYTFHIEQKGYESDSVTVLTREMASSESIAKTLRLKPLVVEKEEVLIAEAPVEGEVFVLKDIQYATDQYELNEEAKAVLDSILIPFLKNRPYDQLMISSHTDDQGSKKYNENLSRKRAEYVARYLNDKGIPLHKIQATGHGKSKPIAPNQNPDGSDNPIGRSKNRRTEFLLVKP